MSAPPFRLAAISVDLDEVPCYAAIHGLETPSGDAAHAIYGRALERFASLFEELRAPATFFVVGSDLARGANRRAIADLAKRGHEIGNHSQNHRYDLTRLDRETMLAEVVDGQRAIESATGHTPSGFRAPGYTITDALFDVLFEAGMSWDSSVFPCPSYYALKATKISTIALAGRKSHSIVDSPRVLTAPADPYFVGRPYYHKAASGIVELPIGVTRDFTGRLPYIGTSVVLGTELAASTLTRAMSGRPLVNLELHGIDLADADADGLTFLRAHQPDLRVSAEKKARRLRTAIAMLRDDGYELVTLSEAAKRFRAADLAS